MIRLKRTHYEQILAHCRSSPDREVCGVVTGAGNLSRDVHPLANVARGNRLVHYLADPQQFFAVASRTRAFDPGAELDLVAVYHSHPFCGPRPSATDKALAGYRTAYIIYSCVEQAMKAWRWTGREFTAEELRVVPDGGAPAPEAVRKGVKPEGDAGSG